jgi:F0F1-type ATP synthase assembly protein I
MGGRKPAGKELGEAWRYDSLGYTFAFTVIIAAGIGWLLDRWLGTRPFLTIVGTLVGAGLAMGWVILKIRADQEKYTDRHSRDRAKPPGTGE